MGTTVAVTEEPCVQSQTVAIGNLSGNWHRRPNEWDCDLIAAGKHWSMCHQNIQSQTFSDLLVASNFCRLNATLWNVAPPIFLLVGTVGNVLSILVWLRRKMLRRSQYTGVLLVALGACDLLVLYTGFLRHYVRKATYFRWDIQKSHVTVCKLHEFLVYFSLTCDAWLVALIAAERCVSIVFLSPAFGRFNHRFFCHCLCRLARCGRQRAIYVSLATLVAVCAAGNLHVFWTRTLVGDKCETLFATHPYFLLEIWPALHLLLSTALPTSVILLSTSVLIVALCCCFARHSVGRNAHVHYVVHGDKPRSAETIADDSQETSETGASTRRTRTLTIMKIARRKVLNNSVVARKSNKITWTLVLIAFCFIVCNSPAKIYLVLFPSSDKMAAKALPSEFFRHRFVWSCVLLLQYLANIINFWVYSVANARFRAELLVFFGLRPHLRKSVISAVTVRVSQPLP